MNVYMYVYMYMKKRSAIMTNHDTSTVYTDTYQYAWQNPVDHLPSLLPQPLSTWSMLPTDKSLPRAAHHTPVPFPS